MKHIAFLIILTTISTVMTVRSWHDTSRFQEEELLYGLNYADLNYFQQYWRPLVSISADEYNQLSFSEQKQLLHDQLLADYQIDSSGISARYPHLSEQQRWLVYLMLRVNGSMPIYAQSSPAHNLTEVVYKLSGSCNAYALRLAFVLRVFGYDPNVVGFVTNSIQGHVVVTLQDIDGGAMLLDANTNFAAYYPNTTERFFVTLNANDSEMIRQQVQLYQFPYYERAFQPLGADHATAEGGGPELRNSVYTEAVVHGWLPTFTTEREELLASLVRHSDADLANDRSIQYYTEFINI